jgi:hypothetical protein
MARRDKSQPIEPVIRDADVELGVPPVLVTAEAPNGIGVPPAEPAHARVGMLPWIYGQSD